MRRVQCWVTDSCGILRDLQHFLISSSSITISHKLRRFQLHTLQGKRLFSDYISMHKLLEVQGVSPNGDDRAS